MWLLGVIKEVHGPGNETLYRRVETMTDADAGVLSGNESAMMEEAGSAVASAEDQLQQVSNQHLFPCMHAFLWLLD